MTDPTADGWTLPDDLYAGPITLFTDEEGGSFNAYVYRDGEAGLECDEGDRGAGMFLPGADDLLTIAARLTQLAHAIQPPTHDPDAAEWYAVNANGTHGCAWTRQVAEGVVDTRMRDGNLGGPWSVKHVSELGQ